MRFTLSSVVTAILLATAVAALPQRGTGPGNSPSTGNRPAPQTNRPTTQGNNRPAPQTNRPTTQGNNRPAPQTNRPTTQGNNNRPAPQTNRPTTQGNNRPAPQTNRPTTQGSRPVSPVGSTGGRGSNRGGGRGN